MSLVKKLEICRITLLNSHTLPPNRHGIILLKVRLERQSKKRHRKCPNLCFVASHRPARTGILYPKYCGSSGCILTLSVLYSSPRMGKGQSQVLMIIHVSSGTWGLVKCYRPSGDILPMSLPFPLHQTGKEQSPVPMTEPVFSGTW